MICFPKWSAVFVIPVHAELARYDFIFSLNHVEKLIISIRLHRLSIFCERYARMFRSRLYFAIINYITR